MKHTKTTLCMLLAASIGSAATATALWELDKRDPLYRLTRGAGSIISLPNRACPSYTIPSTPIPIKKEELCVSYKEQVYDAAIKARGTEYYIRETIDGQPIAYTTDAAQRLYHMAISHVTTVDSNNAPTPFKNIRTILENTFSPNFGKGIETLSDGTPLIDYERSHCILQELAQNEKTPYLR